MSFHAFWVAVMLTGAVGCTPTVSTVETATIREGNAPSVLVLGERPQVRRDGRTITLTAAPSQQAPTRLPSPATAPQTPTPPPATAAPVDGGPSDWSPDGDGVAFTRLVVIGDSLTVGAEPHLRELAAGLDYPIEIRAFGGVPVSWALNQLDEVDVAPSDLVVVALGTNDSVIDVDAFTRRVNAVADRIPGVSVWLTLDRPGGQQLNDALRALAQQRSDLLLADWERLADTSPQWLTADQIHYTATGYRARAEFMLRVVDSLA